MTVHTLSSRQKKDPLPVKTPRGWILTAIRATADHFEIPAEGLTTDPTSLTTFSRYYQDLAIYVARERSKVSYARLGEWFNAAPSHVHRAHKRVQNALEKRVPTTLEHVSAIMDLAR